MKNNFRKEKAVQIAAAGFASQAASAVVMLSLCYAAMPAFAGAGDSLLSSACSFVESETSAQPAALIPVSVKSSSADARHHRAVPAISAPPAQTEGTDLPMVSPSMPDRHWCIAEAFNAALDHKNQESPPHQAAVTVRQPAYTGYCRVPGNETSLKTAAVPPRSHRQCRAVRT